MNCGHKSMARLTRGQSGENGAGGGNRTPDLLITNQLLYQLSYAGQYPNSTVIEPRGIPSNARILILRR